MNQRGREAGICPACMGVVARQRDGMRPVTHSFFRLERCALRAPQVPPDPNATRGGRRTPGARRRCESQAAALRGPPLSPI